MQEIIMKRKIFDKNATKNYKQKKQFLLDIRQWRKIMATDTVQSHLINIMLVKGLARHSNYSKRLCLKSYSYYNFTQR